jgi:hypothetical protein
VFIGYLSVVNWYTEVFISFLIGTAVLK